MKKEDRPNRLILAAALCAGVVLLALGFTLKPSLSIGPEYTLPPHTAAEAENKANQSEISDALSEAETVGEEGELVEAVLEDGAWMIIGERVLGVPVYESAPFQVPARKFEDVPMFPCSDCHKKDTDYRVRELKEKHTELELRHDKEMWCLDCHNGESMDGLISRGKEIDMDLSYVLCAKCHFRQARDWHAGAHGKRIGLWRGTRVLRPCVVCHNPHSPKIRSPEVAPPPLVRTGLKSNEYAGGAPHSPWKKLAMELKVAP